VERRLTPEEIELLAPNPHAAQTRWIVPLSSYTRRETSAYDVMRYG
jgi:hypothetical protein